MNSESFFKLLPSVTRGGPIQLSYSRARTGTRCRFFADRAGCHFVRMMKTAVLPEAVCLHLSARKALCRWLSSFWWRSKAKTSLQFLNLATENESFSSTVLFCLIEFLTTLYTILSVLLFVKFICCVFFGCVLVSVLLFVKFIWCVFFSAAFWYSCWMHGIYHVINDDDDDVPNTRSREKYCFINKIDFIRVRMQRSATP